MKILFAGLFPPGSAPSQRYRFDQYIPYWKPEGVSITYCSIMTPGEYALYKSPAGMSVRMKVFVSQFGRVFRRLSSLPKHDIVIIQREATFLPFADIDLRFFELGRVAVYDIDDAIWLPQPDGLLQRYPKVPALLKHADLVVASNNLIARFAGRFSRNVCVVPMVVDTNRYKPASSKPVRKSDRVVIGWLGSPSTFKTTFLPFRHIWQSIVDKFGERIEFRIMGAGHYFRFFSSAKYYSYSPADEVSFLQSLDIAILSLPDTLWMHYKVNAKMFLYMAVGLPVVATPLGTVLEVIKHGENGLLASTPDEWLEAIEMLVSNPELRRKLGEAARSTVVRHYSIDIWSKKYLQILKECLEKR